MFVLSALLLVLCVAPIAPAARAAGPFAPPLPVRPAARDDAAARADQAWAAQDFPAVAAACAELVERDPDDLQAWFRLGYARHALGRTEEALAAHERAAVPGSPFADTARYNAACAKALLGRHAAALDDLERGVASGFVTRATLAGDADLASLRGHPRFAALWERLAPVSEPSPQELARRRRAFDPWLGAWDALPRVSDGQGGWRDGGWLEVLVTSALDGRLVLEASRGSIPPGDALSTLGYSLRAVDPDTGEWVLLLNWPSPGSSRFYELRGGWRHHRGEFFTAPYPGPQGGSVQTRYTFSDVGGDHMRWDSATTSDGGVSWKTTLIFEKTRRSDDAPPLHDGAARTRDWAPSPDARALDFALGTWRGTRTPADGSPARPVARRLRALLEGVLVEERVELDGVDHAYAVRGWDTTQGAWLGFHLTRDDTTLRRARGSLDGARAVFETAWHDPARPALRTTLERRDDALHVERAERRDDAWVPVWCEVLEPAGG